MALRSILFHADLNGVTPEAVQFAGVQGDHCATEIVFELENPLISPDYLYRAEIVDSVSNYDTTDLLTPAAGKISLPLIRAWTGTEGTCEVRLVVSRLSEDLTEEFVLYSHAGRIYIESRQDGEAQEHNLESGLTALIADTKAAASSASLSAGNADKSAADALTAAWHANTAAVNADNAAAAADASAASADTAAVNAQAVADAVDVYVSEAAGYAEQSLNNMLNGINTHNSDNAAHASIQSDIRQVEAIARGRATAHVFDTYADMLAWLAVPENVETLVVGDNLYIRDTAVKDYWWDGAEPQELEAEAPDLTNYYTKAQVDGMMPIIITRAAYDALVAAGAVEAGRTYYITEGA